MLTIDAIHIGATKLSTALGPGPGGCDGSLRHVQAVFGMENVPAIVAHGGHCDCEFFFNAFTRLVADNMTGAQKHEVAKITQDDSCKIAEPPYPYGHDTIGQIANGSITVTYKCGESFTELIIEPDGTRHVVR